MNRPTVCHIVHSLSVGGAELLARQFALALKSEFRPVFACLDELGPLGEQLRAEGAPVCVLDRRPGTDLRCIWRLANWLRDQKVNLVHAHQYAPFFYSTLARWRGRPIPVLFTEHGRDYPDYRRWKRVWANRILLRRGDHVVAVGEQVRKALIENEGLPPDRIEVIYNGVCAQRLSEAHSQREIVRSELGYTDEDKVIIQVARLNRLKDQATAIRVMARLRSSQPDARLLLVGDGEERNSLESSIASLGLQEHVRLLGARDDVPRLLQAADLFLLTSVSEGIPLTLVEAMFAGVPIVATRVGGVPEVIVDGESGLLAEAGNVLSISTCLERLLDGKELRHRLISEGRQRATTLFCDKSMLAAYRDRYLHMCRAETFGIPVPNGCHKPATERVC